MIAALTFGLAAALAVSPVQAVSPSAPASQHVSSEDEAPPAWMAAMDHRREELIARNGPGTDLKLQATLLSMAEEDQSLRIDKATQTSSISSLDHDGVERLQALDARLTARLKDIVAKSGWPTISLVGIEASGGAMIILAHSQDHAWQAQMLPMLEKLAEADKIDASTLALVVDKELVAEGKLQRYGTQFKFIEGKMAMFAVEEPAHLDERRARALQMPMSSYKKMLADVYHVQITDDVIPASPVTN